MADTDPTASLEHMNRAEFTLACVQMISKWQERMLECQVQISQIMEIQARVEYLERQGLRIKFFGDRANERFFIRAVQREPAGFRPPMPKVDEREAERERAFLLYRRAQMSELVELFATVQNSSRLRRERDKRSLLLEWLTNEWHRVRDLTLETWSPEDEPEPVSTRWERLWAEVVGPPEEETCE